MATDADPHMRWHAMRTLVALDADHARAPLAAMATGDADPAVRAVAVRTLALVDGACPA